MHFIWTKSILFSAFLALLHPVAIIADSNAQKALASIEGEQENFLEAISGDFKDTKTDCQEDTKADLSAKSEEEQTGNAEYKKDVEILLIEKRRKEIEKLELKKLRLEQEKLRLQRIAKAEKEKSNRLLAHIDLSQQKMFVYRGDNLLYKWRVSTARRGYVTPVGTYRPQYLERMHYSKRYHNSPMPHSIFFRGNFAIHGTYSVRRLGRRASHGCVRLHPKNAKKLYAMVRKYGKKNTIIKISY